MTFQTQHEWREWLDTHQNEANSIWLRLAKKTSGIQSVGYDEALDVALRYGWIDGQKRGQDGQWWLQKFTPRRANSIWSKRNRARAEELIAGGQMKPGGLLAVEEARRNGQWDAAYDSPSGAAVPADLQVELDNNEQAKAFYSSLDSRNRYAILHRIQTATKPETRQRRIRQFIEMLEKKEKLYP
jgi:uncharacterized protein YdeI (YjbR/CyaY-like superfamily)